jgi:hypothetical protein
LLRGHLLELVTDEFFCVALFDWGGGFSAGIAEVPGDPFCLLLTTGPVFVGVATFAAGKLEDTFVGEAPTFLFGGFVFALASFCPKCFSNSAMNFASNIFTGDLTCSSLATCFTG